MRAPVLPHELPPAQSEPAVSAHEYVLDTSEAHLPTSHQEGAALLVKAITRR